MKSRDKDTTFAHQHGASIVLGQHLDRGPARSIQGERMKTARRGSLSPASSRSVSNECTWRP